MITSTKHLGRHVVPTKAADELMVVRRSLHNFAAIVYCPSEIVEVRRVWPVRGERPSQSTWHKAPDLPSLASSLLYDNAGGFGIYLGVNPRTGFGQRGDEAVMLARSLVADFDGLGPEDAKARVETTGMPKPTMIINSGHGTHMYWLLANPMDPDKWRNWQKDLAALVRSDPSIHNPERILRAPGFNNTKYERHVPCFIVEADRSRVYALCDLPIPMRSGTDTLRPLFAFRRHVDPREAGDRVERCRRYLAKMPNAIAKQHGHDRTFAAACTCNRFGLTQAEALELMEWFNANKCEPAWSEKELLHKVVGAYTKNTSEHGKMLRSVSALTRRPVFRMRNRGAA